MLGSDAQQTQVRADGLPDSIDGASEEQQQRFFLKLLLESVLENKSNVLDYTGLLQSYAEQSGQAHKGYALQQNDHITLMLTFDVTLTCFALLLSVRLLSGPAVPCSLPCLAAQAHQHLTKDSFMCRGVKNLRRLISCLEAVGILTRTDLAQLPGRDSVSVSARWTLTSVKPLPAVLDTFAAAVTSPPAGQMRTTAFTCDAFSSCSSDPCLNIVC